ncbi:MAG: GerMN domain-containing protein [Clostridia bacterium]|nr:GerMN domain-containing protein [Clostridia bacterium]
MKKSVVVLLLIIALLFTSCAQKPEYIKETIKLTYSPFEMPVQEPQWVTLYYPSEDNTAVLAFSQRLKAGNGSIYTRIMSALLSGTEEGYISPFPQGVSARSIMLVQDILYIDMSWQFMEMPTEQFFACVSVLANTFTALKEVSFINITVEGEQLTPPGLPDHRIMLLSAYAGNISQLINEYKAISSGVSRTFYTAIYVADKSNKYIIPEVVSISLTESGYASKLLSALLTKSTAIFPDGFILSKAPKFSGSTLSVELTAPQDWNNSAGWLGPRAIVCTLDSLFPKMDTLSLTVSDPQGNELLKINEDTTHYYESIRSTVDVITPNSSGIGLTHTKLLVSHMPESSDIREFLNEYIVSLVPSFRDKSIVNSVLVSNDTVIIDLTKTYFQHFEAQQLSGEKEYASVYSLITTACSFSGTTKALILEDGRMRSTLSGHIKLDAPLLTLPESFIKSLS